jgi:hypothetical protein
MIHAADDGNTLSDELAQSRLIRELSYEKSILESIFLWEPLTSGWR